MPQVMTWLVTFICLLGTVLNVRRNIACFYLWVIGNTAWLIFDLISGLYSRAVLDSVQLGFALWGIAAWSKPD